MNDHQPTLHFFNAQDARPGMLEAERIAVLGYGHLGRPFALNLRDSGLRVEIGNIEDEFAVQARQDGFTVLPIAQAAAGADVVLVLLPDEVIPEIFSTEIVPNLRPQSAVLFASGYCLGYQLIEPPDGVDVLMLAPRMAGENARQRFLNGQGFFAYISVEQECSGKAWNRLIGLSNAAGVLRAGALELSALKEADLDLFIEQTVGAVLGVSIMTAFAVGEEAGFPPEVMAMEMYMDEEMEAVFKAFRTDGFFKASLAHGPSAMYGGFIRTMQFMQTGLGEKFRQILNEIHNGEFARQFQAERQAGYPSLAMAMAMTTDDNPTTQAEMRMRKLISGIKQPE
jgi:ketol-acid reductoisomerase